MCPGETGRQQAGQSRKCVEELQPAEGAEVPESGGGSRYENLLCKQKLPPQMKKWHPSRCLGASVALLIYAVSYFKIKFTEYMHLNTNNSVIAMIYLMGS